MPVVPLNLEPYSDHCNGIRILVTQENGEGVAEDQENHQLKLDVSECYCRAFGRTESMYSIYFTDTYSYSNYATTQYAGRSWSLIISIACWCSKSLICIQHGPCLYIARSTAMEKWEGSDSSNRSCDDNKWSPIRYLKKIEFLPCLNSFEEAE